MRHALPFAILFATLGACSDDGGAVSDALDDGTADETGPCEAVRCQAACLAEGWAGGTCAGNACNCYGGPADGGPDADADARRDADADVDAPADVDAGPCSGHGTAYTWDSVTVCACRPGYSPSTTAGRDCVPTSLVCAGGAINYDVDGDTTNETRFDPSPLECEMYELINSTRASHDAEGTPECHTPLAYSVEWSAHGRNHSKQMSDRGGLFHEDYPYGQNCAYGCGPSCEMDMYMNGGGEDHCPPLSHHCNIMRCEFGSVGIGYWTPEDGTWNTQNFF